MRKYFPKTYKFGRLNISIFSHEIILVFTSKKGTYVKSINRFKPLIIKRIFLSFIAVCFVLFFIIIFSITPTNKKDPILEDDKLKNSLLFSSNTDYSMPDNHTKLVIVEHRVKRGENLSIIAKKYGISIDTVCGSNNLRSYDFISEGIMLKIPNKDGILFKMTKGNDIISIARQYRVSLSKIIAENNIKNPDFVSVNKVLFIPDAKPQNIFTGFLWPVPSRRITCGYGWRRNPFNMGYKEFHQGLDIKASYNWVKASKYGKVTYTGWLGGYGKAIIIAHPGGWKTLYAHLSHIIVRPGQYVKQAQTIGKSGNTGRSTGAHFHFEIIKDGIHKNPYGYLKKNSKM